MLWVYGRLNINDKIHVCFTICKLHVLIFSDVSILLLGILYIDVKVGGA